MSATPERLDAASSALREDEAVERRLVWKGLFSFAVVVVLAYMRMRWWL
ncbi:MAG: hypothetical protein ACTHWA_12410 [Arachnia sp.]